MADFVFNIAAGKVAEYAARINANDPANSVFYVHAWVSTAADSVLKDLDDVAAVQANANTAEATNSGYAQKQLDNTSSITITVDDTNDRNEVDCPDQTWTAVAAGDNWTDVSFDYDADSTAGTDLDSAVVPCTWHDFAVTPDGSDITMQLNAAGFFRAST